MTPLTVAQPPSNHSDLESEFLRAQQICAPYTMTSPERRYALWQAVRHVVDRGVPGAFVECGVWRGGSSMLAALAMRESGDAERHLWLFDTFEGMPEPTDHDYEAQTGVRAAEHADIVGRVKSSHTFAFASLEEVQFNMEIVGHPEARVHYIKGKVEDTLPGDAPAQIAVLRLDTDWYSSTRHELVCLWERLAPGGVLIIDDYGHWAGARKAVDEFFADRPDAPLLGRIDYTGRMGVKR